MTDKNDDVVMTSVLSFTLSTIFQAQKNNAFSLLVFLPSKAAMFSVLYITVQGISPEMCDSVEHTLTL
jgi:hypothetical protein